MTVLMDDTPGAAGGGTVAALNKLLDDWRRGCEGRSTPTERPDIDRAKFGVATSMDSIRELNLWRPLASLSVAVDVGRSVR